MSTPRTTYEEPPPTTRAPGRSRRRGPPRPRAPQFYRFDAGDVAALVGLSRDAVLKAVKRGALRLGDTDRDRRADLRSVICYVLAHASVSLAPTRTKR